MDLVLVKAWNREQWQHADFPHHWGSFEEAAPHLQHPGLGRGRWAREVAAITTEARRVSSSSGERGRARTTKWWPEISFNPASGFSPSVTLFCQCALLWHPSISQRSFIPSANSLPAFPPSWKPRAAQGKVLAVPPETPPYGQGTSREQLLSAAGASPALIFWAHTGSTPSPRRCWEHCPRCGLPCPWLWPLRVSWELKHLSLPTLFWLADETNWLLTCRCSDKISISQTRGDDLLQRVAKSFNKHSTLQKFYLLSGFTQRQINQKRWTDNARGLAFPLKHRKCSPITLC